MASIKLCLNQGGKQQLRRTRVKTLDELTFNHLQHLVGEVFPEVSQTGLTFGYDDDEGEFVTIASDRDLRECYEVMDTEAKKALRIEIVVPEPEEKAASGLSRRGTLVAHADAGVGRRDSCGTLAGHSNCWPCFPPCGRSDGLPPGHCHCVTRVRFPHSYVPNGDAESRRC